MGLATIDPHSQKEHTEIDEIPKFGMYGNPDKSGQKRPDLSGFPYISL